MPDLPASGRLDPASSVFLDSRFRWNDARLYHFVIPAKVGIQ